MQFPFSPSRLCANRSRIAIPKPSSRRRALVQQQASPVQQTCKLQHSSRALVHSYLTNRPATRTPITMGWLDGGRSYSYTEGTRSRGHSPARSTRSTRSTGSKGYYTRPSANRSSSSFFGTTNNRSSSSFFGGNNNNNRSSSSFFGGFGGASRGYGSGSSHYKRSPRQGYIGYLFHKLQRMLRELWYYARRHPMKAFFAVIVPLLSAGGAIGGLMKQFGVRNPMASMSSRGGGGYYGSSGYGGDKGGGLMDNLGSVMQIAKAFT